MTIIATTATQVPTGLVHDDEVVATTLPVSTVSGSNFKTLLRVVTPAAAGDILDITGRARVTCELSYTCGVGYYLWMYDADDGVPYANKTWTKIGPYNGDNVWESVTANRHHMPLHISDCYQVPSTWPAGHRMVIVFRADAHSTKAVTGEAINVDREYGSLTVRRWSTAS